MVMLVFIRDLGSSLMFFGGFLALLYVATNRLSFVTIGLGLFALGAWFFAGTVGHVQNRIDTWRDPFDPALYDMPGGSYQIAQSLFAQADGGLFGTGFGQATDRRRPDGALDPARAADRPDLRGDHERARAGRRVRAAARLPDGRRARLQDRDARAGLVLEAARGRADRGLRAAGVRDRRRRDEGDPADRRDAAVRLLRRLLDRRELRAARAAAARSPTGRRRPAGAR